MGAMIIFGHFLGDFFFQTKSMADNKRLSGKKGFFWCSLHALVYTITVAVFVQNFTPVFLLGVFVPHWLVDKNSLGYEWMKIIGRGDLLTNPDPSQLPFGPVIYVVIDQTIHLGSLYILLYLI